ncbi:MAG: CoA transferase [Chloroflexi bacterium]|nr:CoA transferase [Chloroflexota bacterium]MBI3931205.1 CoA transferase [Chloroflexota bacterium]
MAGPLEGIRVLDLSWVLSGPFATMILSDLGAEVIKIERLKVGDISRGNGPYVKGLSSYFLSINRGKKSIALNLASEPGKDIFLKLVEQADVVVENFTPGTMARLGLGYETLKEHNPAIIYAACSGFGQSGPYAQKPAFDVIVQAMGGIMSITGEPGGPPLKPGVPIGDIAAGLFLCIAILACLQERHLSGQGQMIDISMLDCQVAIQENAFVRYLATGELPQALGTRHAVFTPFQVFPTRDSYVAVAMMGGVSDQWPLYCATIGRPDIIDDERFQTGWLRTQNYKVLEPILTEAMKARTTHQWLAELERVGIACGPVNTIDKVANDPQVLAREMFVTVQHPKAGSFTVTNTPIKLSRTPSRIEKASPDLGEDTSKTLKEILGITEEALADLENRGVI